MLTGSARLAQEARDKADGLAEQAAAARRERELVQEQASLEAQAAALLTRVGHIKEELQTAQAAGPAPGGGHPHRTREPWPRARQAD